MSAKARVLLPPLGAHMSIAGGMPLAIERARTVGATALQIFLKNNNQWQGKLYAPAEVEAFREQMAKGDLAPVVAHSSYLINLATPDPALAEKSCTAMLDELARAEQLGVPGIVLHPGAHMGQGDQEGIALIAQRINQLFEQTGGMQAGIWLETTAGQGTAIGWRFEHLAQLIELVEDKSRIGVCLDTCHVFAAGYEMRTAAGVRQTLNAFDQQIGLQWLRAVHVNDSKKPLGSRRDRHEHIGQGEIGEEGFAALIQTPQLKKIPFILETPKGKDMEEDRVNLATLRRLGTQPLKKSNPKTK